MKSGKKIMGPAAVVIAMLVGATIVSAAGPDSKTLLKLSSVEKTDFTKVTQLKSPDKSTKSLLREMVSRPKGDFYLVHVEFDTQASREAFRAPNVTLVNGYKQFADVFIPRAGDTWDDAAEIAITKAPGYVQHDFPELAYTPPPLTGSEAGRTRAQPEEIIRGGLASYTGKNVIIAIVDSGLDFRHPDFITYDAAGRPTSRLLYFWDTTSSANASLGLGSPAPFRFPDGKSIGTLYTKAQLTEDLRSTAHRIGANDLNGHGTAAAGIATGNGNASKGKYTGVAPDADIIGIRIAGSESGGLENEYLLTSAVAWLDKIASERREPLVVSCSFGGHSGGHDGNSVEERHLAARFSEETRGRALLVAAGNEEQDGIHSRVNISGDGKSGILAWRSEEGAIVHIYIHPATGTGTAAGKLGSEILRAEGQEVPRPDCWEDPIHPVSKDARISCRSKGGWAGMKLITEAPGEYVADAYVFGGEFHPSLQRGSELAGTPAGASTAITVGSYDWNDQVFKQGTVISMTQVCNDKPMTVGDISCYSNAGMSRSGVVKPDIVAPGEYYYAPYAKLPDGTGVNAREHRMQDPTGQYTLFNGTSAATPYAAGVVALVMQKKPTISVGELKSLLRRNATADTYTGKVPNPRWGNGKLDLAAVRSMLASVR